MRQKLAFLLTAAMLLQTPGTSVYAAAGGEALPAPASISEELPEEVVSEGFPEEACISEGRSVDDVASEVVYEDAAISEEQTGSIASEDYAGDAAVSEVLPIDTAIREDRPDDAAIFFSDLTEEIGIPGEPASLWEEVPETAQDSDSTGDALPLWEEIPSLTGTDEALSPSYTVVIDNPELLCYDGTELTAEEVKSACRLIRDGITRISPGSFTITLEKVNPYADNTAAGSKYTAIFKIGEERVCAKELTLSPKDLTGLTAALKIPYTTIYDGMDKEPAASALGAITLMDGTKALPDLKSTDYTVIGYGDNKDVSSEASAHIRVNESCGNYTGWSEVSFSITPYTGRITLTVEKEAEVTFTGSEVSPKLELNAYMGTTAGAKLIPKSDYVVDFTAEPTGRINAGQHKKVTIKNAPGKSNLKDAGRGLNVSAIAAYSIKKADLADITIKVKKDAPAGTSLTAQAAKDYFQATLGSYPVPASDYTVSVSDPSTGIGDSASVTLTASPASRNFTGTVTFAIQHAAVSLAKVFTSAAAFVYNDSAHTPDAAALGLLTAENPKSGEATTLKDTDYTVLSWDNNIQAGWATASITGLGIYEGKNATVRFAISPKSINGLNAEVSGIPAGSYMPGQKLTGASVLLKNGEDEAVSLTDADCEVRVQTISDFMLTAVTVTGKGSYEGSVTVTGLAVPSAVVDLSGAALSADIPAGRTGYAAALLKEYVSLTLSDGTLVPPELYDLSYDGAAPTRVAAGDSLHLKATAKTGRPVTGTAKGSITVAPRELRDIPAEAITFTPAAPSFVYDGTKKQYSSISIGASGGFKALTPGTDYTVSYENNINAGTATVTLTGKGNYTGSRSTTFKIAKYPVTDIKLVSGPVSGTFFREGYSRDLSSELVIGLTGSGTGSMVFDAEDCDIRLLTERVTRPTPDALPFIEYAVYISDESRNYVGQYPKGKEYFTVSYRLKKRTVAEDEADIHPEKEAFAVGETISLAHFGKIEVDVDGSALQETKDYTMKLQKKSGNAWMEVTSPETVPDISAKYRLVATFTGIYFQGSGANDVSVIPASFDIENVKLILPDEASLEYDGTVKTLSFSYIGKMDIDVKKDSSKYFTILYRDANSNPITGPVEVGTYTATVVAAENYGGIEGEPVTFSIGKRRLSREQFEDMAKKVKVGSAAKSGVVTGVPYAAGRTAKPACYETEGGRYVESPLFEVVQYDKLWDISVSKTGKAVIRLKESCNYTFEGEYETEFDWLASDLPAASYVLSDLTYNGRSQVPTAETAPGMDAQPLWITKIVTNGKAINPQTATAKVYATVPADAGIYTAKSYVFELPFTILPASIEDAVAEPLAAQTYTGQGVEPALTVTDANGITLTKDTDYTVSYTDNINVGMAAATIRGISCYTGEKTVSFEIKTAEAQAAEKVLSQASSGVLNAVIGTEAANKALTALQNAIAGAAAAEASQSLIDEARALYDKVYEQNRSVAGEAAEAAVKKAAKAAAAAKSKATAATLEAAEAAIDAAGIALAAAIAAGVDTAAIEETLLAAADDRDAARVDYSHLSAFYTAMKKVPSASKVKVSAKEAIAAAEKAYGGLSDEQKTWEAVRIRRQKLDAAIQALKYPAITFRNKTVAENVIKDRKKTRRITLKAGRKLKLKARSSTLSAIRYESSSKKTASVKNGVLTAKAPGKCTITLKTQNTTFRILIRVKRKVSG